VLRQYVLVSAETGIIRSKRNAAASVPHRSAAIRATSASGIRTT
jgi:hypothetical protein